MKTIDLASLQTVTGGANFDPYGAHVGDVASRIGKGALGDGVPTWMHSLSDAGKINEGAKLGGKLEGANPWKPGPSTTVRDLIAR